MRLPNTGVKDGLFLGRSVALSGKIGKWKRQLLSFAGFIQ